MKKASFVLFVLLAFSLVSAMPIFENEKVKHSRGLVFEIRGQEFSFQPENAAGVSWVEKTELGFKWGFNFTLPAEDFKLSIDLTDKTIKELKHGEKYVLNDEIEIDFSDAVAAGLSVDVKNKKIEIKGWDNSLVGQVVELDPFVASTSGTSFLANSNQRKFAVNPQDESFWTSFIGNASCYVGYSANNGSNWSFTNVSQGLGTDQYCSLEIDDYGNVWSYWYNSNTAWGRLFGWNGTGWDLGSVFNITNTNVNYGADFMLKANGDNLGIFYQGNSGTEMCFKACRGIASGSCNQTGLAFWNSTNQTTNSFCSLNTGAWSSSGYTLDAVNAGDFIGLSTTDANDQRLLYGDFDGAGNWLWNDAGIFFDTILGYVGNIVHNSTTIFAASVAKPGATKEIQFRQCSSGQGCNVTSNWTTAEIISDDDGTEAGWVSLCLFNSSIPVVVWDESSGIYGTIFNTSSGDWSVTRPLVVNPAVTSQRPNLPPNFDYPAIPFVYQNNTASQVWFEWFDTSYSNIFLLRAFDELTLAQIRLDATIYNSTGSQTNYTDYLMVVDNLTNLPANEITIDVSNSSYYGRSYVRNNDFNNSIILNAYLLNSTDAIIVRFHIRTIFGVPIDNATVTIQRNLGGTLKTIGQKITDFNGDALFYLQLNAPYWVTVTHGSYQPQFSQVTPTQNDYTIYLYGTSDSNLTALPVSLLDSVYWYFSPFNRIVQNETANLTFYVNDTNDNLTTFGMSVYNDTQLLYFANITNSSGGGLLYYFLNQTEGDMNGTVYVAIWFTRNPSFFSNFTMDLNKALWEVEHTFKRTLSELGDSGLSAMGLGLLFLIVALFVGGWVAKYNPYGALLVIAFIIGIGGFAGAFAFGNMSQFGEIGSTVSSILVFFFVLIVTVLILVLRERL